MLLEHLALTALPGVAVTLLAMQRGTRSVPILLCLALASSGLVALAAFWAYYASPTFGQAWDYAVLLGSIGLVLWSWFRGGLDRWLLRKLLTPLLLWALGSCFVIYLGFLHGGTDNAIGMSSLRFTSQLPSDNDIPRFFSEWFSIHGHDGPPPLYPAGWHMSDRPPLQIGYVLSQRAFSNDVVNLHYQVLCVVIQQLWIVAMWAVLIAARVRSATRSLAMFAVIISDIAIVHGFFVWPKLLAATFLLAALALVISPKWVELRRDLRVAALFACLCALAMLAHGASVFGVIPLVAIGVLRGLPTWRWLGIAALVGLVLMGPWSVYQRYGDPPGNRLLKWQLGGYSRVDGKGTLETIVDGYSEAGLSGTIANKYENFGEMAGWPGTKNEIVDMVDFAQNGEIAKALEALRRTRFFYMLPLVGLFLVAPIAMLLRRKQVSRGDPDWRFALISLFFVVVGCVGWGLLLFGGTGARTVIHAGSLVLPLLAFCGCVAGLRATHPRLAAVVVGINIAIVLAIYTPSLTPPPGTSYSAIAAVLAATSLIGLGLVTFRDGSTPRRPNAESDAALPLAAAR